MPEESHSVAFSAATESSLLEHLVRSDREEDLLFGLWYPSNGASRRSALIHTPIWPKDGDRQRHGNASFNPQYFERACSVALKRNAGLAFMHSHPLPGWQDMSTDDIAAEQKMAGAVLAITGLPLTGLTVGTDGVWSARIWEHVRDRHYKRRWCHTVRSVGERLRISFNDSLMPQPEFRAELKRTITVWGLEHHRQLARLKIGIVGLGSVGSFVAELLARMGFENLCLIDFDRVKHHNLDRTLGATRRDIGRRKISVIRDVLRKSATAKSIQVDCCAHSIVEKEGYQAALDCDVLFSCVDRPRARRILNHIAYAHLIPVIDGGIQVRFKEQQFSGVDWQLQTASPGRPCLECLGAYANADVATETEGKLDDPSYMKGLPSSHKFRRNENVIPFSANLASLEVLQLIALATGIAGVASFGVQRFRYNPGILERDLNQTCDNSCIHISLTARGDSEFTVTGECKAAEKARSEFHELEV